MTFPLRSRLARTKTETRRRTPTNGLSLQLFPAQKEWLEERIHPLLYRRQSRPRLARGRAGASQRRSSLGSECRENVDRRQVHPSHIRPYINRFLESIFKLTEWSSLNQRDVYDPIYRAQLAIL